LKSALKRSGGTHKTSKNEGSTGGGWQWVGEERRAEEAKRTEGAVKAGNRRQSARRATGFVFVFWCVFIVAFGCRRFRPSADATAHD
jgi:hypothetical protein